MVEKQGSTLEELVLKLAEQNIMRYESKDQNNTNNILDMGETWTFDDPQQGHVEVFHRPGMGGLAVARFRLNENHWKAVQKQHQTQGEQLYEVKTGKTTAEKFKMASQKLQPETLQSMVSAIIARNMVEYIETGLSANDASYREQAYKFNDPENHGMRIYHRPGMGGMPMLEFRLTAEGTNKIKQLLETQRSRFNAMMVAKSEQKA